MNCLEQIGLIDVGGPSPLWAVNPGCVWKVAEQIRENKPVSFLPWVPALALPNIGL